MNRLAFFVCAIALALLSTAANAAEADRGPNILFVMVDEMRWNAMGCAGHPLVKTPHLDRLAREGTRFANAYTCAPICTPSRFSFFTSRYAHVHGSVDNGTGLSEPQVLLPSILKHHGYETAISGKLHFRPSGRDWGFDHFWSFRNEGPGTLPTWPDDLERKHGPAARGLSIEPFPDDALGGDLGKLSYPKEDSETFWITDRALDFLRIRDRSRPFFLFVSYLEPHSPSRLPEPYWGSMVDPDRIPLPRTFQQDPSKPSATDANRHEVNDPAIVRAMTAAYHAKMAMVDDNVGRLLGRLESEGLADDTIVVFTADHGNMLGDHNRWFKGVMYEGSARIPLLMKAATTGDHADAFNRGKVVGQIVENIDVMPTLLEMIGHPLPDDPGFQGSSMVQLVEGRDPKWEDVAFAERGGMMVRTPDWKLIRNRAPNDRNRQPEYELYHLADDPEEEFDLANDPARAPIFETLRAMLDDWREAHPSVPSIEGVAPEGGDPEEAAPSPRGKARRKTRD